MPFFQTVWDAFLRIIANILPESAGLPSQVGTAVATIVDALYSFDAILPVDQIITVIQFTIAFEAGILIWHFVRMISNFVRGSGA